MTVSKKLFSSSNSSKENLPRHRQLQIREKNESHSHLVRWFETLSMNVFNLKFKFFEELKLEHLNSNFPWKILELLEKSFFKPPGRLRFSTISFQTKIVYKIHEENNNLECEENHP